MGNSTTAARQPVGFSRPITPESDNRSNGALPSETIMPLPGEAGYLQAYLDSARRKNGTGNGETTIAQTSGELFTGPDTEQFTPPTLEQQARSFDTAQPLDPQAEQVPQGPRTFADALRSAGGTQINPEQSPAANPSAEQEPKPLAPTKAELFAEMERGAVAAQTKALQELRAKFEEAKQAAKQATAQLATTNPELRTAAVKLDATPGSLLGVSVIEHAWALAKTAQGFIRKNQSLSELAVAAQNRKRAKQAQVGGSGKGMETNSVAETRRAQDRINMMEQTAGGGE